MQQTTAIIAALNEAATIERVVDGCLRAGGIDEVIVVDDGSTDDTATRASSAGAKVIPHPRNLGKGAALRRAALSARGETLVTLDADGQDDPRDIPRLLAAIDEGADFVVGSRFLGTLLPGSITPVHRVGNRALTEVLNRLYGVRLTDTQAGLRAIRTSLWHSLPLAATGYEIETEVLVGSLLAGACVQEVPVTRSPRAHGASSLSGLRDGSRILRCMLRLRLRAALGHD